MAAVIATIVNATNSCQSIRYTATKVTQIISESIYSNLPDLQKATSMTKKDYRKAIYV